MIGVFVLSECRCEKDEQAGPAANHHAVQPRTHHVAVAPRTGLEHIFLPELYEEGAGRNRKRSFLPQEIFIAIVIIWEL